MKSLLLLISLISVSAFAETTTVTVGGMHCSACKKEVSDHVCKNEKLQADLASCTVKLTDKKKELGTIVMVPKEGKTVDMTEVNKLVEAAGEKHKVVASETK
ncbi:MAG: hypothetical protein H7061_11420 [Bdellovibrionaceae bacterium]|nr:hypothetical protein [Bdellovibrio sp.]